MPHLAVGQPLEPLRRDGHDKDRGGGDEAPEDDHAVGGYPLGQHADERGQEDDEDAVQRIEVPDGRALAQLANAELRVGVIHVQEDHLDERGEGEEGEEFVKAGLLPQPDEDPAGVPQGVAHGPAQSLKHIRPGILRLLGRDDHPLVGRLDALPQPEVSQDEARHRQRQAGEKDRAVGAQLHPQPGHREPAVLTHAGAQGIGNVEGDEEAAVHDGVEDGVGDGALGGGGVAPQGGDGHRGAHPFADSQHGHAAAQRQPFDGRERQEHARDDAQGKPQQKRLAQPQRIGQRARPARWQASTPPTRS